MCCVSKSEVRMPVLWLCLRADDVRRSAERGTVTAGRLHIGNWRERLTQRERKCCSLLYAWKWKINKKRMKEKGIFLFIGPCHANRHRLVVTRRRRRMIHVPLCALNFCRVFPFNFWINFCETKGKTNNEACRAIGCLTILNQRLIHQSLRACNSFEVL